MFPYNPNITALYNYKCSGKSRDNDNCKYNYKYSINFVSNKNLGYCFSVEPTGRIKVLTVPAFGSFHFDMNIIRFKVRLG